MSKRTESADQRRIVKSAQKRLEQHNVSELVSSYGYYKGGHVKPKNPSRRAKAKKSLLFHLKTYRPANFDKPFCEDHLRVIAKLERCIKDGGNFAEAMPRGTGKTTIGEGAVEWAMLHGWRKFVVVIGSQKDAAEEILGSLLAEWVDNERLAEDFPEVCEPFVALNGSTARCTYQHCDGKHTNIIMRKDCIQLPTIPGHKDTNMSRVVALGLEGRVRGPRQKMPDGTVRRPDFVWPDDPQTDKSARSPTQTDHRESLISGAVMGMAGPGKKIAGLITCTIICPGDLSSRMLNPQKHPDWQGETMSLIYEWPKEQDGLWREYFDLRRRGMIEGDDGEAANEFYKKNRAAMDKGSRVAWEHRFVKGKEISAIQHGENLLCDLGEEAFYAEYQNDPKSLSVEYELTPQIVTSRTNGFDIRSVKVPAPYLIGMTDVNHYGLHWVIVALLPDMTAYVVEYGCYPAGARRLVPKNATQTERKKLIYQGLSVLVEEVAKIRIDRPDGRAIIDMFGIDAGYEMETVFRFATMCRAPFRIVPLRGRGSTYYRQRNSIGQVRDHCHFTNYPGKGNVVEYDADYWRMSFQKAFFQKPGAPGSVSLYGKDANTHIDYARQICAEYLQEYVRGEEYDHYVWGHVPGEVWDWLDASVGAMVLGNMAGAGYDVPIRTVVKKGRRRKPKVKRKD